MNEMMEIMMENTRALRENSEAMYAHTLALKEHSDACNRLASVLDGNTGVTAALTAIVGALSVDTIDTMKMLADALDYYKNEEAFDSMRRLATELYER